MLTCCWVLQVLIQFDVNDGMHAPFMNNSHRCARPDDVAGQALTR